MKMKYEKIEYEPIGIIHSPFTELSSMPIQPTGAKGVQGHIEISKEYQDGLKDLDGFSHLILLYHFHQSKGFNLNVVPFLDTISRGLFATRAPKRPNAIGLSVIQLNRIDGNILHIENIDVLNGTPLLDIKPYVPAFDTQKDVQSGWLDKAEKAVSDKKSDGRFV